MAESSRVTGRRAGAGRIFKWILAASLLMAWLGGGFGMVGAEDKKKPASPEDSKQLLRLEHEWNDALQAHDAAWVERTFAEDATDISSGDGMLRRKADDVAAMKADRTVYEVLELSNLEVRVEDRTGIVTGVNHLRGRDEQGQPFDVRLAFTDTYIKRGGRWQVWASQHTRVRL